MCTDVLNAVRLVCVLYDSRVVVYTHTHIYIRDVGKRFFFRLGKLANRCSPRVQTMGRAGQKQKF